MNPDPSATAYQNLVNTTATVAPMLTPEGLATPDSLAAGLSQMPVRGEPRRFSMDVNYVDPEDPLAVDLGGVSDPYQMDPDPDGSKTVKYGREYGASYTPETILSLTMVGGRPLSHDRLSQSEAGKELLYIARQDRKGNRRGFYEAVTDVSVADMPYVGMVAEVGGSIQKANELSDTFKKLMAHEPVTDDELINATLFLQKQKRAGNASFWGSVGDLVRQAPAFMMEFFATSGVLSAARTTAAKTVSKESIHLAMSRASKVATRELVDVGAEKIIAKSGAVSAEKLAEGEAAKKMLENVAKVVYEKTMKDNPLYKGMSESSLRNLATKRAQYEMSEWTARNAGGAVSRGYNAFTQYMKRHVSRGLIDFGKWGTEEASQVWTNHSKAGRAFMDAVGAFFVEAPLTGALMWAPNQFIARPLIGKIAGVGSNPVGRSQLGHEATTAINDDAQLMDIASTIAMGEDLMEYISESAGRGFGPLMRSAGMTIDKMTAKAGIKTKLVTPASRLIHADDAGPELFDKEVAVTVGGKLREWVKRVLGSREEFIAKANADKVGAAVRALKIEGTATERQALADAITRNSTDRLPPELAGKIGRDVNKFIDDAVKNLYDTTKEKLQYKCYAQYWLANFMAKHQLGPESVMNMYERMGYDGILGEMAEERYSDIAKAILGLDERPELRLGSEDRKFSENFKQGVKAIYPGFDQLLVEAVGFSFPLVTKHITMRIQSAVGGGGRLASMKNKLDAVRDVMRTDEVMEGEIGEYLKWDEYLNRQDDAEIKNIKDKIRLATEAANQKDIDGFTKNLEQRELIKARRLERHGKFMATVIADAKVKAAEARAKGDEKAAQNIEDSIPVLSRAAERKMTVEDRANDILKDVVTVQLLSNTKLSDTDAFNRTPVLTSAQARQTFEGHTTLTNFAPELARELYLSRSRAPGESLPWYRKFAHKAIGFTSGLLTGDFSNMMTNPMQWTARDFHLSKSTCEALKNGYSQEFERQRKLAEADAAARASSGEKSTYAISRESILQATDAAFATEARRIMASNLATLQLRAFSRERMRDQAIEHVAAMKGYTYTVENREGVETVVFYKNRDNAVASPTPLTLDEFTSAHSAEVQNEVFSNDDVHNLEEAAVAVAKKLGWAVAGDASLDKNSVTFVPPTTTSNLFQEGEAITAKDFYTNNKDEIEKAREDIALAAVDVMVNRTTGADLAKVRLVNVVRMPSNADGIEHAIHEAALTMVGLENLVYAQTLERDGMSLRDLMDSTSVGKVNMDVVEYIASKADIKEVDQRAFEAIAHELNIKFNGTSEGLEQRNAKIYKMAQLANAIKNKNSVYFSCDTALADSHDSRLAKGSSFLLKASKTPEGKYEVVNGIDPRTGKKLIAGPYNSYEDLVTAMKDAGYLPASARIVFTQAKVIESEDLFTLIREMGLASVYRDLCQDNQHPMLQKDNKGEYLYADEDTAYQQLRERMSFAACWDGDANLLKAEPPPHITDKMCREAWEELYHPETGYITIGERLLRDRGVQIDPVAHVGGDFAAYQVPRYSLKVNISRLSVDSADIYVPVDFSASEDHSTALINAALLDGYAKNPRFLRDSMSTVISDFIKSLSQLVANRIEEAEKSNNKTLVEGLRKFRRAHLNDVDRVVDGRVERGKGLTPSSFVALASSFVLFRAEEENSFNPFAAAAAELAPYARRLPSFLSFVNIVDFTLGGSGFFSELLREGSSKEVTIESLTGLRRLLAVADGDVAAFEKRMTSTLPSGVSYHQFLENCHANLKALTAAGIPTFRATHRALQQEYTKNAEKEASTDEVVATALAADSAKDDINKQEDAIDIAAREAEDSETTLRLAQAELKEAQRKEEEASSTADTIPEELVAARATAETRVEEAKQNAVEKKQIVRDLVTKTGGIVSFKVSAALKGGEAAPTNVASTNVDVEDEDEEFDGSYSIGNTASQADLPEVFLRATGNKPVTVKNGIDTTDSTAMTPSEARLAANVLIRAAVSLNEEVSEGTITKLAKKLLPGLTMEQITLVISRFRELDREREKRGLDWGSSADGSRTSAWEFCDWDRSEDDTSSDQFNNLSVAEYESGALKDFLSLALLASPETGRNFQAFVTNIRELNRWSYKFVSKVSSTEEAEGKPERSYTPEGVAAVKFLHDLLNPRTNPEGHTLAERLAIFEKNLRVFDENPALIRKHISHLLIGGRGGRALSRKGALLLSYMISCPENQRARFAELISNSACTSPIHVDVRTGLMQPRASADFKLAESVVTDGFAGIIGMSTTDLDKKIAELKASRSAVAGKLLERPESGSRVSKGKRISDMDVIRHNFYELALVLAKAFGAETPLFSALTSPRMLRHLEMLSRRDKSSVAVLAESVSEFTINYKRTIPLLDNIIGTLEYLKTHHGSGTFTRDEVASAFTLSFATGNPMLAGVNRSDNSSYSTSPLFTILARYNESLPQTIMRADVDEKSSKPASSVAIASRGVVPALARLMDKKFREVCAAVYPNATEEDIAECMQDMTWPDAYRTPVIAKSLSRQLNANQTLAACEKAFNANKNGPWWVPVYAGDHSSAVLVQLPREVAAWMTGGTNTAPTLESLGITPEEAKKLGEGMTAHSGGARGADTEWGKVAEAFGVTVNHYYYGDKATPSGNVKMSEDDYKEGLEKASAAAIALGRKSLDKYTKDEEYTKNLIVRDWAQVKYASAVFAIGSISENSVDVDGGTGYAVQMAKAEGKPIHIYDQDNHCWKKWTGKEWEKEPTPTLTKNFAAIGAWDMNEASKYPIRNVFRKTFVLPEYTSDKFTNYSDAATEICKWAGLDLLVGGSAAKRSAVSSLECEGASMVGAYTDAEGNTKFGENRIFIVHTFNKEFSNEELKGTTLMNGYGANQLKKMAKAISNVKGEDSSMLKAHLISTSGDALSFIKSLSLSTSDGAGKFAEGSALRALMDFLEKNTADEYSTGILTDDDSYKIGIANDPGFTIGGQTLIQFIYSKFGPGNIPKSAVEGEELSKVLGDATVDGTNKKILEVLPGLRVQPLDGLSEPMLAVSFQENGVVGYPVANVSHAAHPGGDTSATPKNYEVDAMTLATVIARNPEWCKEPTVIKSVMDTLTNWGLLAAGVVNDPNFAKAHRLTSSGLMELINNGEHPDGQNAKEEILRVLNAQLHDHLNIPLNAVDMPLVSSGALAKADGTIQDHTKSQMHRDMHRGAEVFTKTEAKFYGASHRPALCNINYRSASFRYGWFLNEDKFSPDIEWCKDFFGDYTYPVSDRDYHGAIVRMFTTLRSKENSSDRATRAEAKKLRANILTAFEDHHGVSISAYPMIKTGNRMVNYADTVSFEDLFRTIDGTQQFDKTSINIGSDRVTLDVDNTKRIFLGGTMFGLPRTPSYNGSMWLQVVRAGLPVTEKENEDGTFSPGIDSAVQPDPFSLNILGCDHDGDKTKVYMLFTNSSGSTRLRGKNGLGKGTNISLPGMTEDARAEYSKGNYSTYLYSCLNCGLLERRKLDEDGNIVKLENTDNDENAFFEVSTMAKRHVSNQFVRALFDLYFMVPDVDDTGKSRAGDTRRKYAGGICTRDTKPTPVPKTMMADILSLPGVPPAVLKSHKIVEVDTAAKVSTGANDASDARATVVSMAAALHLAFSSGMFNGNYAVANLFKGASSTDWLNFIYHIDGLSNATFDDMKEQMCSRMGWTNGMIPVIVTDFLVNKGADKIPTTDEEFSEVLKDYVSEVNAKGTPRYWMRRLTDESDSASLTEALKIFTKGGKRITRRVMMDFFGIELNRDKNAFVFTDKASEAAGYNFIKSFADAASVSIDEVATMFIDAASRSGRNPILGYLMSAVPNRDVSGAKDFYRWYNTYSALNQAKSFCASWNYVSADVGDDSESGARDRKAETYDVTVEESTRANTTLIHGLDMRSVIDKMRLVSSSVYEFSNDVMTVATRGILAANNYVKNTNNLMGSNETGATLALKVMELDNIPSYDRLSLEANAQQIPYVAGFLSDLPRVQASPVLSGKQLFEAVKHGAEEVAKHHKTDNLILETRKSIEVLFELMYRLMTTSKEFRKNPAIAYFREAEDNAYSKSSVHKVTVTNEDGTKTKEDQEVFEYGNAGRDLRRIVPLFRLSTEDSVERVRSMVDDIIQGRSFTGAREHAFLTTAKYAGGFMLSRANLEALHTEASQHLGEVDKAELDRMMNTAVRFLNGFGKSLGIVDSEKPDRTTRDFAITPAMMFGQILPYYSLITTRTLGAPTPTSPSIINLLPRRYYERISAAQARIMADPTARAGVSVLTQARMAPRKDSLENFLVSKKQATVAHASDGSPITPSIRANRRSKASIVARDGNLLTKETIGEMRRDIRGGDVFDTRKNPSFRHTLDVYAADDALLDMVSLVSGASTPIPEPAPLPMPQDATTDNAKNEKKADVAAFARALGALCGSWATVEYNGGDTFVLRGTLRGDVGGGHRVVLNVSMRDSQLVDTEDRVESLANSRSFASSLAAGSGLVVGDHKLTTDEFMRLPLDVRKAFVRRYQVGAATANRVAWSMDPKGIATLCGAIELNGGENGTKIYHEYFHAMMRMFYSLGAFSAEDALALRKRFGKAPKGKNWAFNEEAAAEEFRKWVVGNTVSKSKAIVSVFRKIYDMLASLYRALRFGFSYSTNDDTFFQMVVHGVVQASTEYRAEAATQLGEATTATQENMAITDAIKAFVSSNLSAGAVEVEDHNGGTRPAVESELREAMTAELQNELGTVVFGDADFETSGEIEQETRDAATAACTELINVLSDPMSDTAAVERALAPAVATRNAMAQEAGVYEEVDAEVEPEVTADYTVVPGKTEHIKTEVHSVAETVKKLAPGGAEYSLFQRSGSIIMNALMNNLKATGTWKSDLADTMRTMGNLKSTDSDEIKQRVLAGIRIAVKSIDPAAEAKLDTKEIMDSEAFTAALSMYQLIDSSFAAQDKHAYDHDQHTYRGAPTKALDPAHATMYDVSGWLVSSAYTSPSIVLGNALKVIDSALSRVGSAGRSEVIYCREQVQKVLTALGDSTGLTMYRDGKLWNVIDDAIGCLKAGTEDMTCDKNGRINDIIPVADPDASLNPKTGDHYAKLSGCHEDPPVQEALKAALQALHQAAAMAKFDRGTGSIPETADDFNLQHQLRRIDYASHIRDGEWAASQSIGASNLLDNSNLVDFYDQSYVIADNIDAYLRNLVRSTFGGQNFDEAFRAENNEFAAIKSKIARLENFFSYLFGDNVEHGGEILKIMKQKSEFQMEDGTVVHKIGKDVYKFDNYNKKGCGVTLTEDELRLIDLYKKMISAYCAKQEGIVTGVDKISFTESDSTKNADYTWEKISEKYEATQRRGYTGRQLTRFEMACYRLHTTLPEDITGGKINLYNKFVDAACEALRATRTRRDSLKTVSPELLSEFDFNSEVLAMVEKSGVILARESNRMLQGKPVLQSGTIRIGVDQVNNLFLSSDLYKKLTDPAKGNRPKELLDRDYVAREFMSVYHEAAKYAKRHAWVTEGDGQFLNTFGTALPFFRGKGVTMYNAVRVDRASKLSRSEKLGRYEESFYRSVTDNADLKLSTAENNDVVHLLEMLHDVYKLPKDGMDLKVSIMKGDFEKVAQLDRTLPTLSKDPTLAEISEAIYVKLLDLAWEEETAKPNVRGVSIRDIVEMYEDNLGPGSDMFGGRVGLNDEQMYRKYGVLPANFQIGHKVHAAIDGITNSLMQRGTLASMLMTPSYDGAPIYYANPSDLACELGGLPDSFWSNIAHWWADWNSGLIKYDERLSGVKNAQIMYKVLNDTAHLKENKGNIPTDDTGRAPHVYKNLKLSPEENGIPSITGWLVQTDDQTYDESAGLNALGGGEAMGYLRHLVMANRVLGFGGPKVRATLHRALSWSKSMSVSFSFFFPLATRFESPTGAVGAMATMAGNIKGASNLMRKNPELFNSIQKMFGGKGWITKDYLGFNDILKMMDSNDPFLSELYSWAHALGITISNSLVNPMEPTKSLVEADINKLRDMIYDNYGKESAAQFSRMAKFVMTRSGDKAFNYALNATKLAVVAQMAMKLRREAAAKGKAFDPIRDLRHYASYINAEVGGIDPLKYAWAHPMNYGIMNCLMFSWQWTRGAWEAGGGSVIEDFVFGGHSFTQEERQYLIGRWIRMYCEVMIGVPMLMQAVVLGLSKALDAIHGGDDDDEDNPAIVYHWFTFQNEDKAKWTAFDLTPLLRSLSKFESVVALKDGLATKVIGGIAGAVAGAASGALTGRAFGPIGSLVGAVLGMASGASTGSGVGSLVPAYTGKDTANTTRNRRYYMHFGKQGWEFFRWFTSPFKQFASKLSMPVQRLFEGVAGRNLSYLDKGLPWEEQGGLERWMPFSKDSAFYNMALAFLPFTVGSLTRMGDAGFISALGPVSMGASITNINDRMEDRWTKFAENDRKYYAASYYKSGNRKQWARGAFNDIISDAVRNGVPRDTVESMLGKSAGQVARKYCGKLISLMPENINDPVDTVEMTKIARAMDRLGVKVRDVKQAMKTRLHTQGRDWDEVLTDEQRAVYNTLLNGSLKDPFSHTMLNEDVEDVKKDFDY